MKIDALLVGELQPLGERDVPSGIDKKPVLSRQRLGLEGFEADAQGDRKHHGGPVKAVHHYAFEHYQIWRDEIGDRPVLQQPGAFGENLSTSCGLTEETIAIGDVFSLGSTRIQVSQGRQPCWKLNIRFDVEDMARRVQTTGRSGWYYRVLEEGYVEPGDELILIDRISPDWTLQRISNLLYVDTRNYDELAAMAALPHLPESWQTLANRRLATRRVEDWDKRLLG